MARLINDKNEYDKYRAEVEKLIEADPLHGTPASERLSLLALAVEEYEKGAFFFARPTPVEAIRFRMEEQGLNQNDLVPYIGSKSKVSEVLSGKRNLSLPMIRALNRHLGIPVDVLVGPEEHESTSPPLDDDAVDWKKFPLSEMKKIGWITANQSEISSSPKEVVSAFLRPLGGLAPQSAFWRKSVHRSGDRDTNQYSLLMWAARVLILSREQKVEGFQSHSITINFLREVAKLSLFEKGPILAKELLNKRGIKLVFEKHLTGTKLDGGCLMDDKTGSPVIGMTLRHDRLDNFWRTLLHELVHVQKHLSHDGQVFLDDLDAHDATDLKEREAERLAGEASIPREVWKRSDAFNLQTEEAIHELAKKLSIHPAIIAGRIRYETDDYSKFTKLVGQGQVRKLFWGDED